MKEEVTIHRGYAEWEEAQKEGRKPPLMFGKYHHIFSSEKGKVSLIYLLNYLLDGRNTWEIYCLEGDLFEDVERFDSKKDAMRRIREVLE